jgi:hypothetical protein
MAHSIYVKCSHENCKATVSGNKWSAIRAHDIGWFFAKNGNAFCPAHNPPWVAKWRARRNAVLREHTSA